MILISRHYVRLIQPSFNSLFCIDYLLFREIRVYKISNQISLQVINNEEAPLYLL